MPSLLGQPSTSPFVQVADDGAAFNTATTSGDIRIGGYNMGGPGGTLAARLQASRQWRFCCR